MPREYELTSGLINSIGAHGGIRPAHVHADVVTNRGERVLQAVHASQEVAPDPYELSPKDLPGN
jgi:hypothetical protein